jgi:hypothetical protein
MPSNKLKPPEPASKLIRATVQSYDPRRGSGRATSKSGKLLRIPLSAMREAQLYALEPGTEILVLLDEVDRHRIEVLRLVDP